MSEAIGRETVVNREPGLADVPPGGRAALGTARPSPSIAAELRDSRDWRATSLGPAADLSGIDLSGEDLRGVDFSGASLAGASFASANLADANFSWARLAHTDFTGATGLVGSQFARADLTGARVPSTVRFVAFETANEVAVSTGKLFLTLLLVCAYSWLTINSTLDAKLLTDTGASQLPILNAQIPIVNFYSLVPLGLAGLALVTMLQGQRLWAAVGAAPAALPDGTTMADRAGAWILGPWAAARTMPAASRGFLTRLQARLGALIGWWLVPVTVVWFWARYLHCHDWAVTAIQLLALTVTCTAAVGFQRLAYQTLPETYPGRSAPAAPVSWRARLRDVRPILAVALGIPVLFGVLSYAAILGVHPAADAEVIGKQTGQQRPTLSLQRTVPALAAVVPQLLQRIGIRPVAQLEEAEVSTRLTSATASDTGADAKATGARLIGADLRFALAERVYLPLADLTGADLLGAYLWSADLRGANLTGANLAGALLFLADVRKVRASAVSVVARVIKSGVGAFRDTLYCSRTSFGAANLRYARLNGADLRGAAFDEGMLQGATFTRARLTHATFVGADLDGADFRGAFGLTAGQIMAAQHTDALYDSTLLATLKARSPARFAQYDAAAIAAEAEQERLSGDIEPDTLTGERLLARQALMRWAYKNGPAERVAEGDANANAWRDWNGNGEDPVPHGCFVVRVALPAQPAQRPPA